MLIFWLLWAGAVAALILGPIRVHPKRVPLLVPVRPADPIFAPGPFAENAAAAAIRPNFGLPNRGSWLGSDRFEGECRTSWLRSSARFTVLIAGYPALAPNRLELEFRLADGTEETAVFTGENPGARWEAWEVAAPPRAAAVRIHAVDALTSARGWLAFAAPYGPRGFSPRDLWPFLQLGATAALAAMLLYGPGLAWMISRAPTPGDWALAILPGPLLLAALGAATWMLGSVVSPALTARLGVLAELAALAVCLARRRLPAAPGAGGAAVAAAAALLAVFAAAKADLSSGPEGELYAGSISRTLAAGDRPDSRISYHVVQAISHHYAPFSPEAERYFSPWSFASRGPLAGLIAAPVVLALGSEVPTGMPDQAWQPFDPEGFAAYRITLIFLASLAAWAVYGVAAETGGALVGGLATAVALLSPFFVHELYFTWPKLAAAGCVLTSFLLTRRQKPFPAGLALAIADLFHPSALLAAPFLALWAMGRSGGSRTEAFRRVAWFTAGAALLVGPWMAWGSAQRQGWGQVGFVGYFHMADGGAASWRVWWTSRWSNFASTFVPFYLTWAHSDHPSINAIGERSDWRVHWEFLDWDTLPFALGLPAYLILAAAVLAGCRRFAQAAAVLVLGPAALLVAYWGGAETGLMRECGHTLFLTTIVFGVWTLAQPGPRWQRWALAALAAPGLFLYRALEVGWMAFGSALGDGRFGSAGGYYFWNDALALVLAAATLAAAAWILARSVRPPG